MEKSNLLLPNNNYQYLENINKHSVMEIAMEKARRLLN